MNTFTAGNARFTVMTEGTVRMEYARGGKFADGKTFFAERNAKCNASFSEDGGAVTVHTPKFTLKYRGNEPFSAENLTIEVHTGGVNTLWHYGEENKDNLRGTLSTLDGVDGSVPVENSPYGFVDAAHTTDGEFQPIKTPEGLLARDGWHLIDDSGTPVFSGGWAESRDENHLIDAYFFAYGHDYKAALRDLSAVSGKMAMPRKYYMGSWYSRWRRYTAEEFLQILDEYDQNDFPIDILVVDMDWHYQDWAPDEGGPRARYGYGHATNLGWTGYSWDRKVIPDPDGFLKEVHKRGIAVTLSDHPADGVRDHDDTYPQFIKMLEEAGYRESVPDVTERISEREKAGLSRGVKNFRYNAGSKVYMDAFFKSTLDKLTEQGVDFWWIDWQQDYLYPQVNGIKGLTHLQWLNHLYYERSKKGGKRGQAFSRWAGWGDQKHPGAFSGDITTDWSALKYEIQMTVSAGNAGCFWWTHDIGGFADVVGHQAEIYCRWVQFGALSAALRTHSCGEINGIETDRRPWKWGEPFCCAMRDAFHLRSRLMPYLYSVAYQSQRDFLPLLRPLYLDMPECEEAYRHPATYKFGDGLFVAPICEAGKGENYEVTSEIWLPEGQWYSFFTGESYNSGKHCVCDSLFTFPLFAKAGYPIVLQPYQKRMTSSALSEPTVRIYAGRGDICGRTELFEDDGISDAYENGKCRLTEIVYNKEGNVHTVGFTPSGEGYEGGAELRTTLTVELYDTDEPLSVSEGELSYDAERRLATVRLYNIPSDRSFSIVIK